MSESIGYWCIQLSLSNKTHLSSPFGRVFPSILAQQSLFRWQYSCEIMKNSYILIWTCYNHLLVNVLASFPENYWLFVKISGFGEKPSKLGWMFCQHDALKNAWQYSCQHGILIESSAIVVSCLNQAPRFMVDIVIFNGHTSAYRFICWVIPFHRYKLEVKQSESHSWSMSILLDNLSMLLIVWTVIKWTQQAS